MNHQQLQNAEGGEDGEEVHEILNDEALPAEAPPVEIRVLVIIIFLQ